MKLDLADTFLERLSSPSAMTSLRQVMLAATGRVASVSR
jgi:hypothetical protein